MATKTQSLTLRLDTGNAERLNALAGEADVSRSEIMRGLIQGTQPLPAQTGLAKAAAKDSPYRELGTSGLQRFGGSLREEKLRELRGAKGRAMYREMHQNDAVVSAVFFAIEMALRQVRWFTESASDKPEDKQAAEFLEQCLHDQSFTWDDTLQFILTMLEQGFSLLELVYKKRQGPSPRKSKGVSDPARSQFNDGRIGWRKWAPRPAESLPSGNEWIFDEHGGIQGIHQQAPPDYALRTIPIERLLLFRTTPAPANSPEGQSVLRSMYEAYYYVSNIQEIEGIGLERDLVGLPVIYLGRGCTLTGPNSDYEMAKELVGNIRRDEQEGIVICKPKLGMGESDEGMLLELLSSGGKRQFDTGEIINRWDQRKAMTLLAQFIMLGMERVGSYALSRHQGDFFNLAVSAWADGIAQTVNRHAVFRLFRANTFRVTELPRLAHSAVGVPNLEELARYVNALVGSEVLTPDEELERYLREAAQFPERQEQTPTLEKVEKQRDGPDPEAERLKYRKKLQRKYSGWLSGVAGDLVGDDPPEDKRKKLAAALALLALLLKRTGREELPKALGLGRKGEAPSPAGLADLAAQLTRNEGFLGDAPDEAELERMADGPGRMVGDVFVAAVGRKLALAGVEPGIDELGIVSTGETLRSRLGLYDGVFWTLILLGLKDWYGEHAVGEKVKWILDPAAAHCEDCPALAGIYENWDALPTLPGQDVRCNGNCRCTVEIMQDGKWTWL